MKPRTRLLSLTLSALALLLASTLAQTRRPSVASGNTEGESDEVEDYAQAGGDLLDPPEPPTNFKAKRESSVRVKLTWNAAGGASGKVRYYVFRAPSPNADDGDAWGCFQVEGAGLTKREFTDPDAPASSEKIFRYVVAAYGDTGVSGNDAKSFSKPAAEVQVKDVPGGLWSGLFGGDDGNSHYPIVTASVAKFVANDNHADPPPDPFTWQGPYDRREDRSGSYYNSSDTCRGWAPRGKTITIHASTTSAEFYSPGFSLEDFGPHSDFPPIAGGGDADHPRVDMDGSFTIFDGKIDSLAGEEKTFDERSNPPAFMVEKSLTRTIKFSRTPSDGNQDAYATATEDNEVTPETFQEGSKDITFSNANGNEKKTAVVEVAMGGGTVAKAQAVICERKKIVVHVYRVKVRDNDGNPVKRFDRHPYVDTPLSFTSEALKTHLNSSFKDQANVEITNVVDEPTIVPATDKNGDEALTINDGLNGESDPLQAFSSLGDGHKAVFVFTQKYAGLKNGKLRIVTSGVTPANRNYCCVRHENAQDLAVLAHELGHIFGLKHPLSYSEICANHSCPDDFDSRLMGFNDTGS